MTVRVVKVSGTVAVSPSAIASSTEKFLTGRYLFTVPRANVLFYPKRSIERDILERYLRVARVEARFKNFHTLNISVTERKTEALWCRSILVQERDVGETRDDCFLLDGDGFVFDKFDLADQTSPDVLKFVTPSRFPAYVKFYGGFSSTTGPIGQTYLSSARFQELLQFSENLIPLGATVLAFRERPDNDLDVELSGGGRLVINRESDLSSTISNFQSMIFEPNFGGMEGLKKIDYIDMRFGNKIFYLLR